MTSQEIFDTVVNHLRKQGEKSEDLSGCLYRCKRGDKVLKCAIGCLISDDEYSPYMEGKTVIGFLEAAWPSPIFNRLNNFEFLLSKLQRIHDEYEVSSWEEKFEQVARDFNLIYKKE